MFLDSAEDTAIRRQSMLMKDWEAQLDKFLQFHERQVLDHAGKVSHDRAEQLAHERYAEFDRLRRDEEVRLAEVEAAEDFKELERVVVKRKGKQAKIDETKK